MKKLLLSCSIGLSLCAGSAFAEDGNWVFKFGVHNVDPKSDNGSLAGNTLDVDVDSNARPTIALGYYFTPNVQLEVLGAIPFQHDFTLNGAHAGDFKHLPPTISLQYHFSPEGNWDPFLGIGINYTWTYGESPKGPIAGKDLRLGNSVGLAAQLGLEYHVNEKWSFAGDLRFMDINADVHVNGKDVGTVNVDPLVYGIHAIYRF